MSDLTNKLDDAINNLHDAAENLYEDLVIDIAVKGRAGNMINSATAEIHRIKELVGE